MAVSATATRRQAFRGVLLDIASRLNEPDIQKLCFLCKDKISNQCKCRFPNHGRLVDCPYHHGPTGVLVMDQLLERGEFNEWKTEPLRDMLHQIGRVDLASTLLDDYDSVVETKPKDHDPKVALLSRQLATAHELPHEIRRNVESDNSTLTDDCTSLDGYPPTIRTGRSATLSVSPVVDRDIVFTQSLPVDSSSSSSTRKQASVETPKRGQSSEPKYAIVFSHTEVQEMTKMLKTSPSTDSKMKRLLSQKLNNVEPANEPNAFTDDYEVIEKEDCLPLCSPVHEQRMPPRAFSLDSVKAKYTKKKFASRSSVPEITQSCVYLPNEQRQDHSPRSCTCRGACAHSTLANTGRNWSSSRDSGMGHSQDSCDSTEDLVDADRVVQFSSLCREGVVLSEWKVPRVKLFNGIFSHKKVSINKKVHISIGSGQEKRSVNLLLQLHPDGLGNDTGTNTTFVVNVHGVSHPKSSLFLDLTLRAIDCQNQNIISLRNFHLDLSQKSHTFNEFLSHDVIKQSTAKKFHIMFKFQLQMAVQREWVLL